MVVLVGGAGVGSGAHGVGAAVEQSDAGREMWFLIFRFVTLWGWFHI